MTDDTQAQAFKTRLTAYTKVPTLDVDEAQALAKAGTLPADYVLLYVQRRSVDNLARIGGTAVATGYRLSTRVCSQRSISNARLMESRGFDALQLNPVTLDGDATDVRYESGGGDFERDDQSYYSAVTDWIYVH